MHQSETGAIVIAPFANERIREWPAEHFRGLIRLILGSDPAAKVAIVGTRPQRMRANAIVREFSSPSVQNTCGHLSWNELLALVDQAPYVVANNSGIAHIAAQKKKWTLCVFSGSHDYVEWAPRGKNVVVSTLDLPCSPCGTAGEKCPNGHFCMVGMTPEMTFAMFKRAMAGASTKSGHAVSTTGQSFPA